MSSNFRSATIDAHGVIRNATIVDMVTVRGTFSAMGAIYGPIMPVMKTSGRKLTMMASVERINAGRTSLMASRTDFRGPNFRSRKNRSTFSTSVIGSSTKRPSERISANIVTRLIVYPARRLMNSVRL